MSIFFTFHFPRDFDHRYDNVRWRGERFVKKNVVFKFISKDCFRWYYFASDLILWKRNESKPLMWMYLFSHPESASGSRVVDLKEGPSNLGFWSFSIRFGEENFDVKSVKPGVFISYIRVGCEYVLFLEREWRTLKYLLLQNSLSQFILRIEGTILSIISLTLNINFLPNYIIPFLIYILCLKFLKKLRNKRNISRIYLVKIHFIFFLLYFKIPKFAWEELKNKYRNKFLQNQVYPIYFRFIIISYVQLMKEMK